MMINERRNRNLLVVGALTLAALLLAGTPRLQAGQVDDQAAPAPRPNPRLNELQADPRDMDWDRWDGERSRMLLVQAASVPEDEKSMSIKQIEEIHKAKMRKQELDFEMARKELEQVAALKQQQMEQQLGMNFMKALEQFLSNPHGMMQWISETIDENETNLPLNYLGFLQPDESSINPYTLLLQAKHGFSLDSLDRSFLETELPEALQIIDELEANQEPDFFEIRNDLSRQLAHTIRELKDLKQHESAEYVKKKKLFELEVAVQLLDLRSVISSRHLADAADPAEREVMKAELHQLLEQAFDAHEESRIYEAQLIEHELDVIRDLLDKRASHRDQIIQQRMQALTGEKGEFSW